MTIERQVFTGVGRSGLEVVCLGKDGLNSDHSHRDVGTHIAPIISDGMLFDYKKALRNATQADFNMLENSARKHDKETGGLHRIVIFEVQP